ncbi:MAG: hypothetical protein E3J72_15285 [Planctomycetota bacterium]|nr:MAG: hypothetical protein E3J72_15285 [Planctomycetota bacterium]
MFDLTQITYRSHAHYHNPSIMTPDFLNKLGIDISSWSIKEKGKSRTPVRSNIPFENGTELSIDWTDFAIALTTREAIEKHKDIAEDIFIKYLSKLPYVDYDFLVVGYNGNIVFKSEKQLDAFLGCFLGNDIINDKKNDMNEMSFAFVFPLCSLPLYLSIEYNKAEKGKVKLHGEYKIELGEYDEANLESKISDKLSATDSLYEEFHKYVTKLEG